jgi:hypothetical protein
MPTSVENKVIGWKLWLAMQAIHAYLQTFANRNFAIYHVDLDGFTTERGFTLRLDDPAIDALLDFLPFRFSDDYTLCHISMAIGRLSASSGSYKDFEKSISSFQRLAELKASGGWWLLDELFHAGWGRTLSSFVDELILCHQPDDQGLGGPNFYRVNLTLRNQDPFDNHCEMGSFAAASSPAHLTALLTRLVAGELPIEPIKDSLGVTKISVMIGEKSICVFPVWHLSQSQSDSTPSPPMTIVWSRCDIQSDDKVLIKAITDWAPRQEGLRLKAKLLENSLGL